LKHEAERWGGRNRMCSYVSNGALIAAALFLGLAIDEYGNCWPTSPNAKIGVSKRDFSRYMREQEGNRHVYDYATVKAARSPEYNRRIATHEIGHCYVSRAVGSFVDFVTIVPDGMFAGRCVRRGAPSPSLGFVDENAAVEAEPITEQTGPTTDDIVSVCAKIGPPRLGKPRITLAQEMTRAIVMVTELVAGRVC
jgi:hypothetical protein